MTNQNEIDQRFIREAIKLAVFARGAGNHPFGALLVHNGEVVLTAENTVNSDHDVTRHAEMNLVSLAVRTLDSPVLKESTLYSSTEPCAMCSGSIYWAGISRVVFGCSNATLMQLAGRGLEMECRDVFSHGARDIEVKGPLVEAEAKSPHIGFWPNTNRT